jgi:hypothetical protein
MFLGSGSFLEAAYVLRLPLSSLVSRCSLLLPHTPEIKDFGGLSQWAPPLQR